MTARSPPDDGNAHGMVRRVVRGATTAPVKLSVRGECSITMDYNLVLM